MLAVWGGDSVWERRSSVLCLKISVNPISCCILQSDGGSEGFYISLQSNYSSELPFNQQLRFLFHLIPFLWFFPLSCISVAIFCKHPPVSWPKLSSCPLEFPVQPASVIYHMLGERRGPQDFILPLYSDGVCRLSRLCDDESLALGSDRIHLEVAMRPPCFSFCVCKMGLLTRTK